MKTVNHEYYVSIEVAKLLKEAGFDWKCCYCYDAETKDFLDDNEGEFNFNEGGDNDFYSAPTLDVAQRWLREVKDTYVIPQISDYEVDGRIWEYDYRVGIHNINPIRSLCKYKSYEEALEAGIKKALKLILEK